MNLTDRLIEREWTCVANAGHEKIYMLGYMIAPGGVVMMKKEAAAAMCQSIDRLGMVPYTEAVKGKIDAIVAMDVIQSVDYEGGDWADGSY